MKGGVPIAHPAPLTVSASVAGYHLGHQKIDDAQLRVGAMFHTNTTLAAAVPCRSLPAGNFSSAYPFESQGRHAFSPPTCGRARWCCGAPDHGVACERDPDAWSEPTRGLSAAPTSVTAPPPTRRSDDHDGPRTSATATRVPLSRTQSTRSGWDARGLQGTARVRDRVRVQ